MYCEYYQAATLKNKTWFVIGCFRNEENLTFARTINTKESILEFFVTPEYENQFLKVINYLKKTGYILQFKKLPNRLKNT